MWRNFVDSLADYELWLKEQTTFAQSVAALNNRDRTELKVVSSILDAQFQIKEHSHRNRIIRCLEKLM